MNINYFQIGEISKNVNKNAINEFILLDEKNNTSFFKLKNKFHFDGICFLICKKGKITLNINSIKHEITNNMLVIILPTFIIECVEVSDDFSYYSWLFSLDFISEIQLPPDFEIYEKIRTQPCKTISSNIQINLNEFFDFMLKRYNNYKHCFRKQIVKCLLFGLIGEIWPLISNIEDTNKRLSKSQHLLNLFFALIRDYHKIYRDLSFYANKMCISTKYLTNILLEMTNQSPSYWINSAIILTAKTYLTSTNMTIQQIAEELNFSDTSVFSRFFRKHSNMSPSDYKKRKLTIISN